MFIRRSELATTEFTTELLWSGHTRRKKSFLGFTKFKTGYAVCHAIPLFCSWDDVKWPPCWLLMVYGIGFTTLQQTPAWTTFWNVPCLLSFHFMTAGQIIIPIVVPQSFLARSGSPQGSYKQDPSSKFTGVATKRLTRSTFIYLIHSWAISCEFMLYPLSWLISSYSYKRVIRVWKRLYPQIH